MKIALYAGTFVKDKDGAVRSIYQLVASFRKEGHEVMVWSPDVSESDDHGGVPVYTMPSVPIPLYPDYRLGFFSSETRRQLDRFAPDIVHISTPDIIGRKFLLYALKRSLPVASAYHTDFPSYLEYYRLGFAEGALWRYLAWFYNSCGTVLAPNEIVRRNLLSHGIRDVGIWSRGIDRGLFHPGRRSGPLRRSWDAEGRTVLVFAGRFVWYKDIRVVMDLYRRFHREGLGDRVRFVMIGSGPEEETLRGEMPEAVFTGYLTGTALPEAYASGDIFLFPSTTEAFCNVTLEGISCGLPAVVSDVGGCREVVELSRGGLVARAGDVDDFYRCCTTLMEDVGLFGRQREAGLAYAASQSWDAVNGALIERYRRMTS
ncbi:glycosyltransferase family 1 protein [Chlorobium sp. N1]|uniref:glycosyltransferase family 4 protein n=1 Tax=Chlorobium sp. N1 TaxID=2491138 RepID=UPI0010401E83|nr:glycosyltransferase family 1 protein [Chlorobium sp. N1]TCD47879.1 glycosyltransferase family 1 protein [Chlorobium sp. N1]